MDEGIVMSGILGAIIDGFSSFFSIWQVCILQISPFFFAWVAGLYFAAVARDGKASLRRKVVLPGLTFTAGFICIYALLTMSGLPFGRMLIFNLGSLSFLAGGYILLASLLVIFSSRLPAVEAPIWKLVLAISAIVLGGAFASTYSPCITPALSKIMGLAGRAETTVTGGILALFYGLGICLALTLTCTVLIFLLSKVSSVVRHAGVLRNISAALLAALGILNLTGMMIYYKAFFLGFLVG